MNCATALLRLEGTRNLRKQFLTLDSLNSTTGTGSNEPAEKQYTDFIGFAADFVADSG